MRVQQFSLIFAGFLAISLPLAAHHSFAAEYDETKPIKVTGVVTKVEWLNPHVWFFVDVKGEDGKITNWAFSGGAPGQLMRRGVTHNVIKEGMTVVVDGFRAKDASNNAFGQRVTFPDGRQVFTSGGVEIPGADEKGGKK